MLVTRRTYLDGWQGPLAGQRVRGAPLAQPQAERSLLARLRDGGQGQEGNCRLPALLQRGISVCAQTYGADVPRQVLGRILERLMLRGYARDALR